MCSYILLSVLCVLVQGSTTTTKTQPNVSASVIDDDFDDFIPYANLAQMDSFDWKLLQKLSFDGSKNVIISPLSLKLILALLYEGAGGITEQEFQTVLNFPADKSELRVKYHKMLDILQGDKRKEYVINIGTRIFLDSSLNALQPYKAKAQDSYKTDIINVNFTDTNEASKSVNSWVAYLTNGRISKLVDPDDLQDALLLVTNALYFKGLWRHQFNKSLSFDCGFYLSPSEIISVQYMSNTDKYFYTQSKVLDAQILRIPYRGRKFAMYIVLPNSKGGLPNLIQNLNFQDLKRSIHLMDEMTVEVIIPKFKFNYQTRYSKILYDLGLQAMFKSVASFPGIVRGQNLQLVVTDIIQKAGIEANEEGSVIYAATDIQIGNKFREPDTIFNASHPFLFFIEEQNTGTILFIGKVENPLEDESIPLPTRFADDKVEEPLSLSVNSSPSNSSPSFISSGPTQSNSTPVSATPVSSTPVSSTPSSTTPLSSTTSTYDQLFDYLCAESVVHHKKFCDALTKPVPSQGTTQQPNFAPPPPSYLNQDESSTRFNYFDLELLKSFNPHENLLISPASIKSTLGMILEGSGGQTSQEIVNALRVPANPNRRRELLQKLISDLSDAGHNTILQSSNGVFASDKYDIVPTYRTQLEQFFRAFIKTLDFSNSAQAANLINSWISNSTRGLVTEIISPSHLEQDTAVVITNALYFKALWSKAFDEQTTQVKCFHSLKKDCIQTHMMQTVDTFNYKQNDQLNAHVIELPYSDGKHAMLIVVPKERHTNLVSDIQHFQFTNILSELEPTEILLELPRFDIEYSVDLIPALKAMGIRTAFESRANLSGIVEDKQININGVLHKTKIEVNEKGTTAAAATGAIVIPLMGSSMPRIIADHPFLFFIYKIKTGDILFEGILNEPKEAITTTVRKPVTAQFVSTRQGFQPIDTQTRQYSSQPSHSSYDNSFSQQAQSQQPHILYRQFP